MCGIPFSSKQFITHLGPKTLINTIAIKKKSNGKFQKKKQQTNLALIDSKCLKALSSKLSVIKMICGVRSSDVYVNTFFLGVH